jgi:subtilisin-like proprotein convertase family protein
LAALLAGLLTSHAQITVSLDSGILNAPIPDGDLSGLASSLPVSTPMTAVQSVSVTLNISGAGSGAFNGDFYAYLAYDGELAVLLNRPGRTAGNDWGYGDDGLSNVTFDDAAVNGDVHSYRLTLNGSILTAASPLTGNWAPDGRNTSPDVTLDTTSRTATLASFAGLNPNGNWTLFVADTQAGGTGQLDSWILNLVAVPEPADFAVVTGVVMLGIVLYRRKRRAA